MRPDIDPEVLDTKIQAKINGEALKVATRHWGVDGLRLKKNLLPFDGGKTIDIS